MKFFNKSFKFSLFCILNLLFFVTDLLAQVRMVVPQQPEAETDDYTWWYVLIFALIAGLGGAVFWNLKVKKGKREEEETTKAKRKQLKDQKDNAVDFDSELEWYRKNKKVINKTSKRNIKKPVVETAQEVTSKPENTITFEKKLAELQFSQLPISRFDRIELPRPFIPLPISNDEALMSAIEQTHDEFEEDEDVRDLAVRILARFKTKNSIEALSQVALYDLSSTLRSKAVGILSDFDHESVFETLLLACADPTREVKAAAARGLFRLSFDRADCWMRIAESGDEFRMRHATRAAIAGDLVRKIIKQTCSR